MTTVRTESAEPRDANARGQPEGRDAFRRILDALDAIFNSSPMAVAALDRDRRVVLWSRAATRLFGWDAAEILGNALPIVPDEAREQYDRLWATVIQGEGVSDLEVRRQTRAGEPLDLVVSMAPLVTATGEIAGVLSVYADITRHRSTDRELVRVDRALRTLTACDEVLTRETDEVTLLRETCRIIVESGYRMAWVGYAEPDEARTVRPMAFAGFEDGYIERLQITWADTARGRGPTGTAIREDRPALARDIPHDPLFAPWREDALRRGYAASIALPLRDGGRVFGALMIYARDPRAFVDEEVALLTRLAENLCHGLMGLRARAAREAAEAKARQADLRYRTLFETATESILLMDDHGTILDVNPAVATFLGHPAAEIVGRSIWEVARTENPDLLRGLLQALLTGKPVPDPLYFAMFDTSGRRREVMIRARIMRVEHAPPVVTIIGRDITEERDSERVALENERLAALGRASAFIGHELTTPLTNIGLVASAMERSTDDLKMKERLAKIQAQRALATQFLSDLLSISRPIELHLEATDLREVIHKAADEVQVFRRAEVTLELSLPDGPVQARVDPRRIMQVLDNLLKNALEATATGSVTVRLEERPEVARIAVEDTGTGIPPELLPRIWEPFFTTKPRAQGNGLGLPLCRSIVSAHHGTIDLHSEVGKGTTFTVTLPRRPRSASAAASGAKA